MGDVGITRYDTVFVQYNSFINVVLNNRTNKIVFGDAKNLPTQKKKKIGTCSFGKKRLKNIFLLIVTDIQNHFLSVILFY